MKIIQIKTMIIIVSAIFISCKSLAQNSSTSTLSEIEQKILGSWILENDSSTKIVFTDTGKLNRYYNNNLELTEQYEITQSCNGETYTNYFLKSVSQNGSVFGAYLENVNYGGSNLLVLMTQNQGKIIKYTRP